MSSSMEKIVMRQLKQLAENPIEGVCAAPAEDGNLREIHCTVVGPPGTKYEGVAIHFVLELDEQYPVKAPHAFFVTHITYHGGAEVRDDKGRIAVCLNLFGNFGFVHTEWGKSAEGWSAAYTLETVLVQMQSVLHDDYLAQDRESVAKTKKAAASVKCNCGHTASCPYPAIPTAADVAAALSVQRERGVGAVGGADAAAPTCYVSGVKYNEGGCVMGLGVCVARNGSVTTPAEYLSLDAFKGGAQRSSDNVKEFKHFLPLSIDAEHHKRAVGGQEDGEGEGEGKPSRELTTTMAQVCGEVYKRHGLGGALASVCGQMMTGLVVEVMNQKGGGKTSDRFIDCYFQLLLLLERVDVATKGKVRAYVREELLRPFVETPAARGKDKTPNLGTLLALLPLSGYTWAEVREPMCFEVGARNVFWVVEGPRSEGPHPELKNEDAPERCTKMFAATGVSRKLVCFQRRFLEIAAAVDVDTLEKGHGCVDEATKQLIKRTHEEVGAMQTWDEHHAFLGLEQLSDAAHTQRLVEEMRRSAAAGYHGGRGGKKGGKGGKGKGKGGKGRY